MRSSQKLLLSVALLAMALGCDAGVAQEEIETPAPPNVVVQEKGAVKRPPAKATKPNPDAQRLPKRGVPPRPKRPVRPPVQPPPGPQPRVQFEHKKFDFKTAIRGEKVTHSYPFKNTGESDLVIEKVQPSCGCVAVPLKKNRYAPGEDGEIKVSFDSGKKSAGLQRFTIAVHTNDFLERDRGVKISVLELQGDVIVYFKAIPPQFYLQRLYRGETTTRQLTLHSTGLEGAVLEIDHVEASDPSLQVEVIQPSPKAGTGAFGPDAIDLLLAFEPRKIGHVSETVTVYTTSKKQPKIEIMVRGMVEGDIKVSPPTIYARNYRRGGPLLPGAIRVQRTRGGIGLKILEARSTEGLTATVQQIVAGKHYNIRLAVDPNRPPGPFAGEVRILVNSEEQPMVTVPVIVHVKSSVEVAPDAVYFESQLGAPFETKLTVRRLVGGPPMEVTIGEPSPKHFTAEVKPPDRRGLPHEVILKLKPDTPVGAVKDSLIIRTNVPGEEEIVIPINGQITGS